MFGLFISVRSASTRLPGKALKVIEGKATIEYLINRVKESKYAEKIILCTTNLPEDQALCDLAKKNGISFFRGSAPDKLLRWFDAATKYNIEFFVNVDGDDLFFDAGLADACFDTYLSTGCDFVDGKGYYNDVYGIHVNAISKVIKTKRSEDTEFIRPYFVNTESFHVETLVAPDVYEKKGIRMTLDYADDFVFFETVIQGLKNENRPLSFNNIINYLKENPDVKNINYYLESAWQKNQESAIDSVLEGEQL